MSKKAIAAGALAATLALGILGCGTSQAPSASSDSAGSQTSSVDSAPADSATQFATLKELIAAYDDKSEWEYDDKQFIYAATDGTSYIRAWCDLTPEVKSTLEQLSVSDTDKKKEAIGPLVIKKQEVYALPAKSELDALVGKTGAELEAEGFTFDSIGMSGPDTVGVGAIKEPFFYMVVFDGHVDDMDTPDVSNAVKDFKVQSVEVTGLSRPDESAGSKDHE
ncbi:MAG: hypothetical protein Q4A01_08400 [Coriobacteriales bacterium]|nr:hypothetical protein [Coriobacteriales bacterium]